MDAWWGSRKKALTMKRKMDENDVGADEVLKRDERPQARPSPIKL